MAFVNNEKAPAVARGQSREVLQIVCERPAGSFTDDPDDDDACDVP